MILRRIHHEPGAPIDVEAEGASEVLDALYRVSHPRWLRVNLISSVNGDVTGAAGTSEELSNRADRAILTAIRRAADAVLVGASSIRAEGFHVPRGGTLVVVSSTGDFGGRRPPTDLSGAIVVACPEDSAPLVRRQLAGAPVEILPVKHGAAGDPSRVECAALVGMMRSRGLDSIVCEGGPSLATQLLDSSLVDELCLSTSPVLTSGSIGLTGSTLGPTRLSLEHLLADDQGGLYARWQVTRPKG